MLLVLQILVVVVVVVVYYYHYYYYYDYYYYYHYYYDEPFRPLSPIRDLGPLGFAHEKPRHRQHLEYASNVPLQTVMAAACFRGCRALVRVYSNPNNLSFLKTG